MIYNQNKIRIIFFGTPDFAAIGLDSLLENNSYDVVAVVTQPDKPVGRGGKIHPSPVKDLALKHNIPILQPECIKRDIPGFIKELSQFENIEIGVVIAFGQILPLEVLNYPRKGCVNVHASLLPRWRGAAPIQRAIMAGDSESGVCLMNMEVGLDTGGVYSCLKAPITNDMNSGELHDKLASLGAEILSRDIIRICNGEVEATPQSEQGISYASKITHSDLLIKWNQPSDDLARAVRALSPIPGAYSYLNGKRIKIFKARSVSPLIPIKSSTPGKIAFVDSTRLEVECLNNNLTIEEVQLEGKRRLPIREFLKGVQLDTTDIFTTN